MRTLPVLILLASVTAAGCVRPPASDGSAPRLEATSRPGDLLLEFVGSLSAPQGVAVTVPYTLSVSPVTSWDARDPLLSLRVKGGAILPQVEATIQAPEGPRRLTLDGLLSVEGDPSRTATIRVLSGSRTSLLAKVSVEGPNPSVDLTVDTPAESWSLRQSPALLSLKTLEGDTADAVLAGPAHGLEGVPPGLVPADAFGDPFRLATTDDAVVVQLLEEALSLPGAVASGDLVSEEGVVVRGRDGALLTARAEPPTVARPTWRLSLGGSALAKLAAPLAPAGAGPFDRVVLEAGQGIAPAGWIALAFEGADGSGPTAVQILDPVRLNPALTLVRGPAGPARALVPADARAVALGADPATLSLVTGPDGAFTATARGSDGPLLTATASQGNPLRLAVAPGAALAGALAPFEIANAAASALAATFAKRGETLLSAKLGPADGLPLVSAERLDGGNVRLSHPGGAGVVPQGEIALEGDPTGLADLALVVRSGGTEVFRGVADREAFFDADPVLARPVVRVTASPGGGAAEQSFVIAGPFVVGDDPANPTALRVPSPLAPATSFLALEKRQDGAWRLSTPAGSQDFPAGPLTYSGDLLRSDRVTLTLKDPAGSVVQSLTLDRSREPALVALSGLVSQTVEGPLAYTGDASAPSRLAILHPADGSTLLDYAQTPDGAARLEVPGAAKAEGRRLVRFEGDARGPGGFALVVLDPKGNEVARHAVDRGALLRDLKLPADRAEPFLSSSETGAAAPSHLALVRDARENHLPRDGLSGDRFLSRAGPHEVVLQVPRDREFTRIELRLSESGSPRAGPLVVPFTPAPEYDAKGHRGHVAAFAPDAVTGAEGGTVAFSVTYENAVSPFASQASFEDANRAGFRYRLDGGAPTAGLSAPPVAEAATFPVRWTGADALSGVSHHVVQKRDGNGLWEPWLDRATSPEGMFTGEPGKTYAFRARAVDAVGNEGAWSAEATSAVPPDAGGAGAPGENHPPTVALLSPQPGAPLSGVVRVAWTAADPDGTKPVVNLYVSRDGGLKWKSLYSGTSNEFEWDTRREPDGESYKLKVVATDGSLSEIDSVGKFRIANEGRLLVPESPPAPPAASPEPGEAPPPGAGTSGGGAGDAQAPSSGSGAEAPAPPAKKRFPIPGPGVALLAAAAGAVAVAFRRARVR